VLYLYQQKQIDMKTYLINLLNEKGISLETVLEANGSEWGVNFIPMATIVEFMCAQPVETQNKMKANLVKIDFHAGDVMHFFQYAADFLAK